MNLEQMLEHIRASEMMKNITAWAELPAKEAVYEDFGFPDERIIKALEGRESGSCTRTRPARSGRYMRVTASWS